jgi:hypothetical protein
MNSRTPCKIHRVGSLTPKLDFYADISNMQRISEALSSSRRLINRKIFVTDSLDVFVLNLNKPHLVEQILQGLIEAEQIFSSKGIKLNAYIGDTGSSDPSAISQLRNAPSFIKVSWFDSYNFSRSNNDLFTLGDSQFSLFLNNDVLISENPSSLLMAFDLIRSSNSIATTSAVLNFPDGTLQHGGIDYFRDLELHSFPYHPNAGKEWEHSVGFNFKAMAGTGAFLLVRSEEFAKVNGFNERYESECQDVELCLEFAQRGFETRIIDTGLLVHLENATRPIGEENWPDRRLFMRRWASFIEATQ